MHARAHVRHLASAEPERHLDAVASCKKLSRIVDLGGKVIGVDIGRKSDLLDLDGVLLLLGILLPAKLFVPELAVVNDLADRRLGIGLQERLCL